MATRLFLTWILACVEISFALPPTGNIILWPNGAPNETKTWPPEERTPDDGDGCGFYSRNEKCDHIKDVSVPMLIPFIVTNGTGAAVVIAPGGGYHDLAWSKEGLDVAALYNSFGVSAFVLKYRVPARPKVPGLPDSWAPLQDAQRAMGLVRAHAKDWGLNPSQIGFTGFSAGGHLTAHISTTWRQRAYARVDASDDLSCRPDFSLFMYPWRLFPNNRVPAWGQAYNLSTDFSGMDSEHPVSFFCQNEDDLTAPVEGTLAYYTKVKSLAAKGKARSSLHVFPTGGHGFGLCQGVHGFLEVCDWPKAALRFLQDHGFAKGWPSKPTTME